MICPYCNATELIRDSSVAIPDPETGGFTTYDYWACLNPRCSHFQKIINGTKAGNQGEIMTVEQAKAKESEDREIAKTAKAAEEAAKAAKKAEEVEKEATIQEK